MHNDIFGDISREDIEKLAGAIASVIAETREDPVAVYNISILDTLDLSAIASSVAGVTDPIGQLKDWLYDVLKKFVDTIVNAVQSAIQSLVDNVIEPALNYIASTLGSIADTMSNWFSSLYDAIQDIASTIKSVVIDKIRDLVDYISDLVHSLGDYVSTIMSDLRDSVDAIVSSVSTILDTLSDYVSTMASKLGDMLDTIKSKLSDMVSSLKDALSSIASSLSDTVTSIASDIEDAATTIASALSNIFSSAASAIDDMMQRLRGAISSIADKLSDMASSIGSTLASLADSVAGKLRDMASSIADSLSNLVSSLTSRLREAITDIIGRLGDAASTVANKIKQMVSDIAHGLSSLASSVSSTLKDMVSSIADKLRSMLSTIGDEVKKALTSLGDAVTSLASKLRDAITNALSALADSARRLGQELADSAKKLAASITDAIRAAADKLSDMIKGLAHGLSSLASSLTDKIRSLLDTLAGTARKLVDELVSSSKKAIDALSSAAHDALAGLAQRIQSIITSLAHASSSAISALKDRVIDAFTAIKNTIASVVESIKQVPSIITGMVEKAASSIRSAITRLADHLRSAFSKIIDSLKDSITRIIDVIKKVPEIIEASMKTLGKYVTELASKAGDVLKKIAELYARLTPPGIAFTLIERYAPDVAAEMRSTIASIHSPIDALVAIPKLLYLTMIGVAKVTWFLMPKQVKDFFNALAGAVRSVGDRLVGFVNAIMKFPEWFPRWFREHIAKPIVDTLRRIGEWIWEHIPDWLKEFFSKAVDFFRNIPDYLKSAASAVVDAAKRIVEAAKAVGEGLKKFFEDPLGTLKGVLEWLWEHAFKPLGEAIVSGLEKLGSWIWEHLPDWLRGGLETLAKGVETIASKIHDAISWVLEHAPDIKNALIEVKDAIISFVKDPLGTLRSVLEWLWEHALKPLGEHIYEGLRELGSWIWEHLPDSVKAFFEKAGTALADFFTVAKNAVESFLKDPVGSTKKFLMRLWDALISAKDWIVDHVLKPLGELVASAAHFIVSIVSKVVQTVVSGAEKLAEIIYGGLSALASAVTSIVAKIAGGLFSVGRTLYSTVLSIYDKIVPEPIKRYTSEIPYAKYVEPLIAIAAPLNLPMLAMFRITNDFVNFVKDNMPALLKNPVSLFYAIANAIIPITALGLVAAGAFRSIAGALKKSKTKIKIDASPLGVGVQGEEEIEVDIGTLIGGFLDKISDYLPDVSRYIMIGHMIWWAEPTRVLTRYWLTNALTIELPPLDHALRALRRHLPTMSANDYYTYFVDQLRMGGIGLPLIRTYYPLSKDLLAVYQSITPEFDEKTLSIVITDRFGQPRLFPATLIAEIPTPSELAHMMIRDIILNPRDFAAVMAMHGFTPDVAFMFYLLHFRYPSPERLADFFWRGIAGELWNPDESYDKQIVELFFKHGQPPRPIAPKKLNFAAEQLFEMMKQYMKWHDYARIPWRNGWPTDNAIIMELISDIPGKIDLRWMTRWGLFDYWGSYGVTATTTIEEITRNLLAPGQVTQARPLVTLYKQLLQSPQPVFDVRQFARALQATGVHPYWVPWITLAETINALSEERTLLRTGFINLYREGIFSLNDLNELLSGFFTVVFKTAFFDPSDMKWKEVDIEYPVAFLPAESKLLELRAVMDKALDIYREAYRRIIRAIAFNVVSVEQGKAILGDIVLNINEKFFAEEISKITGKTYYLGLDEGYWAAWSTYASVIQQLEAVERTRFYARYIIWSVLWGLRYGYTTKEEAEKWVDELVKWMNEHPLIKGIIKLSVDFMLNRFYKEIAVRSIINLLRSRRITLDDAIKRLEELGFDEETALNYINANVIWYTPSITTYASMLEVVPEATQTILSIVDRLNMPVDELPYWKLYLLRQNTRDELTLVRTRIYNMIALGATDEEIVSLLAEYGAGYILVNGKIAEFIGDKASRLVQEYNAASDILQVYGISKEEWVLYHLIGEMEKRIDLMRAAAKERIPSPTTIASIAEYLVLPETLVEKTLEEYHVDPEWMPYWLEYIRVKPLKSDYKTLLSAYMRALRYGVVSRDQVEKLIKRLENWGFTPEEIRVIEERVNIEEAISAAREYIPTPISLATIAEYVPEFTRYAKLVLEKRRVPRDWWDLWLRYIDVRPIANDVRGLLTAYRRAKVLGVDLGKLEEKILKLAKEAGWTDRELDVLFTRITVEQMIDEIREIRREYLPTPRALATLAEYIPIPENFIKQVFERRHVPEEWRPYWLRYIKIRPVADDVRTLITAYFTAKRYGVPLGDLEKEILGILKYYGLTEEEIRVRMLAATVRAMIDQWREIMREYVPTPMSLATIAEYVPEARKMLILVLERRHVPREWWDIWAKYVHLRPLSSEIREVIGDIRRLYEYFAIRLDDLKRLLSALKNYGLEDEEIQLLLYGSKLRASLRAYRELLGTPRQLVTMAEYSPQARRLALAQVYKMIDALPVDQATKEFLKKTWEEYIRVRPVYDEVRRYITELINDYAEGLMDDNELRQELEALKDWGLDDYEIQFYIWLAQRRRARRAYREAMRQSYYGAY